MCVSMKISNCTVILAKSTHIYVWSAEGFFLENKEDLLSFSDMSKMVLQQKTNIFMS